MKIERNKKLVLVILISIVMVLGGILTTVSYADGFDEIKKMKDNYITYHENGNIKVINLQDGYLAFFESGKLDAFYSYVNDEIEVTIDFLSTNELLNYIDTPSGTISVNSNGVLNVSGYAQTIIDEAQKAVDKVMTEITDYFSKINIDIDGVLSPKDDLQDLKNTLNNLVSGSGNSTSGNLGYINTNDGLITYHENGNLRKISMDEGYFELFEDGNLDCFYSYVNGETEVTIEFNNTTKLLEHIVTPSGTIEVNSKGKIYVSGYANVIIEEAQNAIKKFTSTAESFLLKSNIDLEGIHSPKNDIEKVKNILNNLIGDSTDKLSGQLDYINTGDGLISYYDNGNLKKIIIAEGHFELFEDGSLDCFYSYINGEVDIAIDAFSVNKMLNYIKTPSGSINVSLDGNINCTGVPSTILEEKQNAINRYLSAVEAFIIKANIDLEGIHSPKNDIENIKNVLNNVIENSSNKFSGKLDYIDTGDASITYYENGKIKKISMKEGYLTFFDDGKFDNFYSYMNGSKKVEIDFIGTTKKINYVDTISGRISFDNDGKTTISGSANEATIIGEAQSEIKRIWTAVEEYLNKIHIDLPRIHTPKNDIQGVKTVLNTVLSTISNGQNVTLDSFTGNVENNNLPSNGSMGNGIINNGNGMNVSGNNNGSIPNISDNTTNSGNNIVKYVLIGLAFLVVFVVLIFGIIAIKKKNNQIVVK